MRPTLSLAMIVKPDPKEAVVLRRALKSVAPYVDEICLTITGHDEACEAVAKDYGAIVSHIEWKNDFVAARNFNFAQATKDYIFWIDCDDVVQGAEKLPNLMELIGRDKIDTVVLDYLYHFNEDKVCDVKHTKNRILKNDQCVEWFGMRLHEDFRQLRELHSMFYEEIKILHLSDEERMAESMERNVRIAEEAFRESSNDPRAWWLLGNAYMGTNRYDEALQIFDQFIRMSGSEEEKYLVYINRGSILRSKGKNSEALIEEANAMLLRPWYPNAYFQMAQTYFNLDRMKHAKTMLITGMAQETPRYEIIVFNPREYDYHPLMLLAKVYLRLLEPANALLCLEKAYKILPSKRDKLFLETVKEQVANLKEVEEIYKKAMKAKNKKEIMALIESVPVKLRSHPAIMVLRNQHLIRTESSGKDVSIFCGHTKHEWAPDMEGFIGGSEEAVINLAKRWTASGWNVTVYCSCGHIPREVDGVWYRPWWEWNHRDRVDVLILWRSPKILDFELNAATILIDLHDVIGNAKGESSEFTPERVKKVKKIMVKSEAHKNIVQHYSRFPIPDEKFCIVPNGIDVSEFEKETPRDPYLLINTSSPDRSLETLLDLYKEALDRLPEDIKKKVKLDWRYGWQVWNQDCAGDPAEAAWQQRVFEKFDALEKEGYVQGGDRLSLDKVNELYRSAGAFVYPTQFYEIHCISAAKAQAAGCVPIVTDTWALKETVQFGNKIPVRNLTMDNWIRMSGRDFGVTHKKAREEFVSALVKYLMNPRAWEKERDTMSAWARKRFNWDGISKLWEEQFV